MVMMVMGMVMVMGTVTMMIIDLNQGDIGHHFLVNKAAKSGVVGGHSLLTRVVRSLHKDNGGEK